MFIGLEDILLGQGVQVVGFVGATPNTDHGRVIASLGLANSNSNLEIVVSVSVYSSSKCFVASVFQRYLRNIMNH